MAKFSFKGIFGRGKKSAEAKNKNAEQNAKTEAKEAKKAGEETGEDNESSIMTGNIGIRKEIKISSPAPKFEPQKKAVPDFKAMVSATAESRERQAEKPAFEIPVSEEKPAEKQIVEPIIEKPKLAGKISERKSKAAAKKKIIPEIKQETVSKNKVTKSKKAGTAKKLNKKSPAKSLEKEIREFELKPKAVRENESEGFDFSLITKQIKEKVEKAPSAKNAGEFDVSAIEQALESEMKQSTGKNTDAPATIKKTAVSNKSGTPSTSAVFGEFSKDVESPIRTATKITRIPSGVKGLDELIEGGFEEGSTVLLVGSAGTGKTLFALQFLYNGAVTNKEPGIFISFEEERESLFRHSSAFGWDFEKLEKEGKFKVLEYKPHQVEKLMQAGGGPIKDQIRAMGAKRLVIDSITSYGLLFRDEYQRRENILGLFDLLQKWGTTSMIISELPPKVAEVKEGSVGFLTDAIISLYYTKEEEKGVRVHSCEILKMRGTRHTNKLLALGFERDGLAIYPEVEVF